MAQTASELIAEVKRRCGRTGDTVLATDDQVAEFINEAQREIVDRVPGMPAITFVNTGSLDTTQTLRYALGDITMDYTGQSVAKIRQVFYFDTANDDCYEIKFCHEDEFNSYYYDATSDSAAYSRPHNWTQQGQYLELAPLSECGYVDKDLKIVGDFYPRDLTAGSSEYSDLSNADAGLKYYALWKCWRDIGNDGRAKENAAEYENWLEKYDMRQTRLDGWGGSWFEDGLE